MPRSTDDSTDVSGGERPLCSVLVPILNEERHIEETVTVMRAQRAPGPLEFLLIDGGSTDRTPEILEALAREDPRIRLIHNPRREIPSALNVGLKHARGRWIARMDAHARYPPDYIAIGIERLGAGDTRWVSGPQVPHGTKPVERATGLALGTVLGRGGSKRWGATSSAVHPEYELDSGVFCGVWARDTLLEYGGWDERWSRNEDSELAARFLERGEILICVPTMATEYTPRNSFPALWRQYLKNGEFRAMTAGRHAETLRRSNLLPPALTIACALSVAAPAKLRLGARAAVSSYAAVVLAAGVNASAEADTPLDAALVPAILATMHLAFGAGFIRGAARNGLPVAAIAWAAGLRQAAQRWQAPAEPVFAPSLDDAA